MHCGAIKWSGQWCPNGREPLPSVEDPHDFMSAGGRAVHNGTDRRVQPWAVATTG